MAEAERMAKADGVFAGGSGAHAGGRDGARCGANEWAWLHDHQPPGLIRIQPGCAFMNYR
ncbi:hypothetical protein ACFYXH_22625 [Streptomyces sp. NPDC002730]|uniref:hypothetical protein n=1 Tax=Streptomyces sp. NPDC002730 TaxID=3364662 RepID=UPI00367B55F8